MSQFYSDGTVVKVFEHFLPEKNFQRLDPSLIIAQPKAGKYS